MQGAFAAKEYRNLFAQCGYSQEDIDRKVEEAFQTIFYGPEDQRFYHPRRGGHGLPGGTPATTTPALRACPTGMDDVRADGQKRGVRTAFGSGPRPTCT